MLVKKTQGWCSDMLTVTDSIHSFISEVTPCKLEALVSQKTERKLETGEQEEVAEINQAQHLKLQHSCKDIHYFFISMPEFTHALHMGRMGVSFCLHRGILCEQYSLFVAGGSFTRVTAEKWNKDSGCRRSLESPKPEDDTWDASGNKLERYSDKADVLGCILNV